MARVLYSPLCENDSYLVKFNEICISPEYFNKLLEEDAYLRFKYEKFKTRDISKDGAELFKDRPSFRNLDNVDDLAGSVYTHTVEERNDVAYKEMLQEIDMTLKRFPETRRLLVRFSNPINEYIMSELSDHITSDLTCISFIHYLRNKAVICFRANDIKNEMYYDFVLVYWFFLRPIYRITPIDVTMIASTAQNIAEFSKVVATIDYKCSVLRV